VAARCHARFEEEAKGDEDAVDVTARRFIRRSLGAHPEWRGRTLFIDGLDEVRARGGDLREPLDTVIGRLATFERACEALVRETNREHLDARDGDPFAYREVVLAAG